LEAVGVKHIGFERFGFDVVSLPSEHLLNMTDSQFLSFFRKFFHTLTYLDKGRVRLVAVEDIVSPWKNPELGEEKKDVEKNDSPVFKVNTRFLEENEEDKVNSRFML
jgi:hypothetical protein